MSPKKRLLSLNEVFNALDNKDYSFYSRISEEKRKEFNPFPQLKYNASAMGNNAIIGETNKELNINFWEISKHPKLVWMILCAINPKIGRFNRKYLSIKKNVKDNKKTKFLRELYPTWKLDDIEVYAKMCDKKELKQLAIEHGYDDKSIREKL